MNWEWSMSCARRSGIIFGCRYRVYGVRYDMGNGISLWMYRHERVA